MKSTDAVIMTFLACLLGSCSQIGQNWPRREKEVPVSKPETPAESQQASAGTGPGRGSPGSSSPASRRPAAKPTGDAQVVAASLLQVNNHFFTVDDIVEEAGPRLVEIPRSLSPAALRLRVGEAIAATIRDKVNRTLVLEQAERRMTEEITKRIDVQVQDKFKEMVAEAGGSTKLLEQKLKAQGTTLDRELESYRDSLKVQSYLQAKFTAEIAANRRVLLEYYRQHIAEFTTPKKVQMRLIAAPLDAFVASDATESQLASARGHARQHIIQAAKELRAGKEFSEVARSYSKGAKASEGGLWPAMPAGSFRHAEVERVAFAMPEGHVSGMIETDSGFFIVKADKVYPEKTASFEEVQADIEQRIRGDQYSRLAGKYFDELYDNATINRRDEFLHLAVERAVAKYFAQ